MSSLTKKKRLFPCQQRHIGSPATHSDPMVAAVNGPMARMQLGI